MADTIQATAVNVHFILSLSFTKYRITHKHTHCFNGYFPYKSGLTDCLLDFYSPLVPNFSLLSGQARTLDVFLDTNPTMPSA